MESTLFTALSTNEEANLSGGARDFSGNNFSIGNTAVSVPITLNLGGTSGSGSGSRNGNIFSAVSSSASAGNISRNRVS